MPQYSYQPCDDAMYTGNYQIIRWNDLLEKWEPMPNEIYPSEEAAEERIAELNN